MPTFANLESLATVRTKMNAAIRLADTGGTGAATVAAFLASTEAARGNGSVWSAGGFRYEETDAVDYHVENAAGVRFYVLPAADGTWPLEAWGAPLNNTGDDTPFLKAAIDAVKVAGIQDAPPTIVVGPGKTLRLATSCVIDGGSVKLSGFGANIRFVANNALDIGSATYLTDITQGNYTFIFEGFFGQSSSGVTAIRNRGYRKIWIDNVYCLGGATFLETEGAFAGAGMRRCRVQSTTGTTVKIKQRNNNWTFENNAITGADDVGITITTVDAELKGIQFVGRNDVEGCAGGIYIEGLVSVVSMDGMWFENNTLYNIKIDNTLGTFSKDAITITRSNITGAGVDVLIGTDTGGTLIKGVSIEGNEFGNSDLILIGGDRIQDLLIGANRFSGTGVITMPAASSMFADTVSLPPARVMPLHFTVPVLPFGTGDTKGVLGELRWGAGQAWMKTSEGWVWSQMGRAEDATTIAYLPTGATPSVTAYRVAWTANGGATTVTSFSGGIRGQELIIVGGDVGNTTIAHGTNIRLLGGANFTLGDNDTLHLVCINGTRWAEVARSNNN